MTRPPTTGSTTMPGGFELRDHTADLALYAWGPTLEALFTHAAAGLYAAIGTLTPGPPRGSVTCSARAPDVEGLLQDFLSELLLRFDTDESILSHFAFDELTNQSLRAAADAHSLDRERSILDREVKAVTYHDLAVLHGIDRYEVTIILDI